MAIDIKLKEGYLSGPDQNQETQALLRVIIDELKDIGVYLAQQNNRIEEISKKQAMQMHQDRNLYPAW
jgi:hypothetical protein